MKKTPTAILLIHCPDQKGIVAVVTEFIYKNGGNVVNLEQHIDAEHKVFFMRVEFDLSSFAIPSEKISEYFQTLIGERYKMTFKLHFSDERPRMAIFVTKMSHCLYDLLYRWESGMWKADIPLVVSNHDTLKPLVEKFGIPFYHLPVTKENKAEQEQRQMELLEEHNVDFVVLARYMQILSEDFIKEYDQRCINIHHSFLPAFPGAKPYHSAHQRGVKVIGATSHYVTAELDAGPIIEQDVARAHHGNTVQDLVRMGQDLEKVVLSRAVHSHLERKILVYENKTVIFN